MAIAIPPATDALTVDELRQLARLFDAISDETGARYAAVAFVDFVRAELADADELADVTQRSTVATA